MFYISLMVGTLEVDGFKDTYLLNTNCYKLKFEVLEFFKASYELFFKIIFVFVFIIFNTVM